MACCAFAIFVVAQLLAPFVWLRRRLFGERSAPNVAVAWTLQSAATSSTTTAAPRATAHPRARVRTAVLAAVVVELAIGVGAVAHLAPHGTNDAWVEAAAFAGAWCRS